VPRSKKHEPNYAAPKPTVAELLLQEREVNHVSVDFLKIDVATALTFVGIARETKDAGKKRRNQTVARKAYDTVQKFAKRVDLTQDDVQVLSSGMKRLKSELKTLGETF
jgi:hypothetical protein